ncbi:TIGR03943 family protein [Streptomyces roseirectus]|uniref:TIGR03943 family protein n=1 Tax=Streptomyces roseirectus TaxID=2768066 RepID=A0A7H0IHA7_9ACTN|nr:TIGR03943 family protein [Streptomyces roseirectus]QNP72173.1 TIGR03943 family protein [Streptomyces roseirectus]
MKRVLQAALLALTGAGLLQVALFSEVFLRYVKEGMRPPLILSGVVLLLLGAAEAWAAYRHRGARGAHVPPVAWLLFLPALSLLVYAPPELGSYTASRESPKAVAAAPEEGFGPLPSTSPLPITLGDFTSRVQQDRTKAIAARSVTLTGFVTPAGRPGEWYLTRLLLSCCAADAQSLKVKVYGVTPPKADTWVSVTGTWHPSGALGTASAEVALDARTLKRIDRPSNGYQDALPLG